MRKRIGFHRLSGSYVRSRLLLYCLRSAVFKGLKVAHRREFYRPRAITEFEETFCPLLALLREEKIETEAAAT